MISSLNTKYLQAALRDSHVIEIRTLPSAQSGRFDSLEPLLDAVKKLTDDSYMSLNRPHPCEVPNAMGTSAFKDADIETITRIPFDFDPVRETGQPATDHQIGMAEARRLKSTSLLRACGWPDPLLANSGNGVHAIYRTQMPANDETKSLLRRLYAVLAKRYTDDKVTFDPTVRNPSRILRLYGTINHKAGRPSFITHIPPNWDVVTEAQIRRFVDQFHVPANVVPIRRVGGIRGAGDYSTLDVVAWFKSLGLYVRELDGIKHGVACPWAHEHTTPPSGTDTVVWTIGDSGWPTFHCSHAHCIHRNLLSVIDLLGPPDQFCAKAWRAK